MIRTKKISFSFPKSREEEIKRILEHNDYEVVSIENPETSDIVPLVPSKSLHSVTDFVNIKALYQGEVLIGKG